MSKKPLLLIAIALFPDLASHANAGDSANAVELKGQIAQVSHDRTISKEFVVRIDDPGWTILFPDLKDGYRGYEEIRFDGRNTFATTCFKHLTNAPIGAVDITSEVRTGPLPGPEKIHMGSFLWFALCSERFLAAHHEAYVRLDPLWPSADEVFSMRYQPLALISGSSSVPHLPAQAKFFLDDGIDFTSKDSIGATIRQWRRNELPKDAESGRLWCTYASSGRMSEKTLSFEFPREFEFRVFIFPRSVVDPGEASDGFYSIKGGSSLLSVAGI